MRVIKAINESIAQLLIRVIDLFYITPLRRLLPLHTFRYLACGVGNYIVMDTLLYWLIYHYVVGMKYYDVGIFVMSPHVLAMVIVFPITFLVGFWLNRYVAFESTQQRARVQVVKYGASVVGSIVISYLALKFFVEVCGVWATPAKGASSVITALYSYLAARYFTFKKGVEPSECANRK